MDFLSPIIAHRGASAHAPENTLAAFRRAAMDKAQWIECDAKLTADGRIILFHDDLLDRTSNGHGKVADQKWDAIRALDSGSWFAPAYQSEKIPLLEEAMDCWFGLGLNANIEIKPCPGRDEETARIIMEFLRRKWPSDRPKPLVSSFSFPALKEAKKTAPEFPLGLLLGDYPDDWAAQAKELSAYSIHCWDKRITEVWARAIKQAGFRLLIYTVNDPGLAKSLFAYGVDAVFTDYPSELRVIL